jgi:hypothetical protein
MAKQSQNLIFIEAQRDVVNCLDLLELTGKAIYLDCPFKILMVFKRLVVNGRAVITSVLE